MELYLKIREANWGGNSENGFDIAFSGGIRRNFSFGSSSELEQWYQWSSSENPREGTIGRDHEEEGFRGGGED